MIAMWVAEQEIQGNSSGTHSQKLEFILKGPICCVGRKADCEISFPNDKSVSRQHANFHIHDGTLFVVDLGSKFQTFKNGEVCLKDQQIELSVGDVVTFGALESSLKIFRKNITLCLSRVDKNEKDSIGSLAKSGKLHISKSFDNSTHIVCNKFSATIKVLSALVLHKPVVSVEWVRTLSGALTTPSKCVMYPDESNFLPAGGEALHLASPSVSRRNLFEGLCVILFNSVDNQYIPIIEGCQGVVEKMYEKGLGPADAAILGITKKDVAREVKEPTTRSNNITVCIFYDESTPPTEQMFEAEKTGHFPFLTSGALAASVLSVTKPVLVRDFTVLRMATQSQSQLLSQSQVIHSTNPPQTAPSQNSFSVKPTTSSAVKTFAAVERTTTLVSSIGTDRDVEDQMRAGATPMLAPTSQPKKAKNTADALPVETGLGAESVMKEPSPIRKVKEFVDMSSSKHPTTANDDGARQLVVPTVPTGRSLAFPEPSGSVNTHKVPAVPIVSEHTKMSGGAVDCDDLQFSKLSELSHKSDIHTNSFPSSKSILTFKPLPEKSGEDGWLVIHTAPSHEEVSSSQAESSAAETIERVICLKVISQSMHSTVQGTRATRLRDVRSFRKNPIPSLAHVQPMSIRIMARVLPKESEREIQLRIEAEEMRNKEKEAEELFADRFGSTKKRGRA